MKYLRWLFFRLPFVRGALRRFVNVEIEIDKLRTRLAILEQHLSDATSTTPDVSALENTNKSGGITDSYKKLKEFVAHSVPGTTLQCRMNNVDIIAPIELLKIYLDTLVFPVADKQPFTYLIENKQCDWLCSKLSPGDTALDIGASYGCITLPMSLKIGIQGQVHAFEPAITTRKFLQRLLELNHCQNVTVVPVALSDSTGKEEFVEYKTDNQLTWASDMSRLTAGSTGAIDKKYHYKTYQVDVMTLDKYVFSKGLKPKAIKIDVEGWEFYVLMGGKETLSKFKPSLCIDTHADVKTQKPCVQTIVPFLKDLGYHIQTIDRSSDIFGLWQVLFATM